MKPGARAYSAAEKADILEKFIHATEAGKSQREAAETLGVNPTTVMYWRGQVERGAELTDSTTPEKKPKSVHHYEAPLSVKKDAVRAFHAGEGTQRELAEKYGVDISTIAKWVRYDREGRLMSRVKEPKKARLKLVEPAPAPPPEPEKKPRAKSGPPPKKGRLGTITLAEEPAQAPAAASMSPEQVEIAMLRAENARLKRALVAATS